MKEVYVHEIEDPRRGSLIVKWKDRMKECMHESC